jgi:hypothetical protein
MPTKPPRRLSDMIAALEQLSDTATYLATTAERAFA